MNRIRSLIFATWIALLSSLANGEELQLGTAPINPGKAGFTMLVLTERLGNEGFQPITLRFRAFGKSFIRERRLRILFRPRTQYANEIDFQFSCDAIVPQGVKSFDLPVLVPHFYRWESCSVQIYEDGRRWGRAASGLGILPAVKDWGQKMSIGVVVPVDAATSGKPWAKFPDVRSIVTVLGQGPIDEKASVKRFNNKQARDYLTSLKSGWARFRIIDEDALQTSWIGYSQLDLILVPYPVLQRIEQQQPVQLDQLRRWVSAGGQIWAYAAPMIGTATEPGKSIPVGSWLSGKRADTAKEIQYSADPSKAMMLSEVNDTSAIEYYPWNYGAYSSSFVSSGSEEFTRKRVYKDLVSAKHPMIKTEPKKQLESHLEVIRYGMGRVVLIDAEDPFPGSFQLWGALETERQTWSERNGVDYSSGNDSYWSWLMATVGLPPVTMFLILNVLFVLVMGPVLYFGLRRRSRLYLLYFIAPSLALITTMGLFLYAFLSDGFDNRARVRQLTWIDGRQPLPGKSTNTKKLYPIVSQLRETYYSVVDSQQGLRFDLNSFVLPVHHSETMNNYNYSSADSSRPGRYLVEQTNQQRLYSGDFLPTRTQTHYLVTQPTVGTFPIEVDFGATEVRLTNFMATALSSVAVIDDKGKYWVGSDVSPHATIVLKAAEKKTRVFAEIALGIVDPDSSESPVPYQSRASGSDRTGMEETILEFSRNPPGRSFVAVTDVESSQFALRDCVQEDCTRLIGGLLP